MTDNIKSLYSQVFEDTGIYIYLQREHFTAKQYNTSMSFFREAFDNGLTKQKMIAKAQQLDYIKQINQYGDKDIDVAGIIAELGNEDTLQEILNAGAQHINDLIAQFGGQDLAAFGNLRKQGYQALFAAVKNKNYPTYGLSESDINTFFNTVAQAQGLIDKNSQATIGMLKQVALGQSSLASINREEVEAAGQTAKLLLTILEKGKFVKGSKEVNVGSVIGSLHNIYGSALGEAIVIDFFENLPSNQELESTIKKGLTVNTNTVKTIWSGTQKSDKKHTFKVDALVSGLMSYGATKADDMNYSLELGSNISVKWASGVNLSKKTGLIHILGGAPFGEWLSKLGKDALYRAGNLVTHYSSGSEGWAAIRNSLAANFCNEWLAGDGGMNTAQYIMINGKVYSILDLVDKAMSNSSWNMSAGKAPLSLSFANSMALHSANKAWAAKVTHPDTQDAINRNRMLKDLFNKILISVRFNANFLP